jgi:hypothetical protein
MKFLRHNQSIKRLKQQRLRRLLQNKFTLELFDIIYIDSVLIYPTMCSLNKHNIRTNLHSTVIILKD